MRRSNCTVLQLRLNRPVPDRILRFNRSGSGETRSPKKMVTVSRSAFHTFASARNLGSLDLSLYAKSRSSRSRSAERPGSFSETSLATLPRKFDTSMIDRLENSKKCSAVISRDFFWFFWFFTRPISIHLYFIAHHTRSFK